MSCNRFEASSNTVGNGTPQDFTVYFNNPFPSKNYEIAVDQISLSFSWFNISAALGNNLIGYKTSSGGTTTTFTIPDGVYGIPDISAFLQLSITTNGGTGANITLSPNGNTLKTQVNLLNGYCLDLSQGSLWELLGYNSQTVITTQGLTQSPNEPNVTTVNTVFFHCSAIRSAFYNGKNSDIIATYSPNAKAGSFITIQPNHPVYQAVSPDFIENVRFYVTDDQLNILNLNGQPVTYSLILRPISQTDALLTKMITLMEKQKLN
jgi:hypothetical protein